MGFHQITLAPSDGAKGESISVSTSSVQSAVLNATQPCFITFYCDVSVFIRQGTNPTAVTNTDQFIPGATFVRIGPFAPGSKLAIIGGTSGTAYINRDN